MVARDRAAAGWRERLNRLWCNSARYDLPVAFLGTFLLCVGWSVLHGQDMNPDLRNYHVASVYRLLHDRSAFDLAPSQMQGWFNPVGYLPFYGLIHGFAPLPATVLLCLLHAANVIPAFLLARAVFREIEPATQRWYVIAAVAAAITSSSFLEETGTSFLDVVVSIPMLFGAWLIVRDNGDGGRAGLYDRLIGGALVGVSIGLKLTGLLYLPGVVLASLLFLRGRRGGGRSVVALLAGLAVGFAVGGGWWHLHLWLAYGNPVFPVANDIFHSPWADPQALTDRRFLPRSAGDWVTIPVRIALGTAGTTVDPSRLIASEIPFRDLRYLVGVASALIVGLPALRWGASRRVPSGPMGWLAIFFLVSYVCWLGVFGIARYAIVLEMVAGVLVVGTVQALLAGRWPFGARWMPVAVALLLCVTTDPATWMRASFRGTWFETAALERLSAPDTTYVFASSGMVGYVEAYLPPKGRVVRVAGNFPMGPETLLQRRARALIATAPGPLRTLRVAGDATDVDDLGALRAAGVVKVPGSCVVVAVKSDPLESCALRRIVRAD